MEKKINNKGKECKAIVWWKKHKRVIIVLGLSLGSFSSTLWKFSLVTEFLCKLGITNPNIQSAVFLLLISAPVSFYFWVIRNKDRLDAIKEQQESNKNAQEANDYTSFSHALTFFAAKEIETKAIGLKLLIQIRNKPNSPFTKDIDLATKYAELDKANLAGANLQKANLEGANLYSAYLYSANLYGANLCSVNLCGADLQHANLHGAKLQPTRLYGANLQNANLHGADLQGAQNLLEAGWAFAQNIEQAIFDNEETKQKVLALRAKQEQKVLALRAKQENEKENETRY